MRLCQLDRSPTLDLQSSCSMSELQIPHQNTSHQLFLHYRLIRADDSHYSVVIQPILCDDIGGVTDGSHLSFTFDFIMPEKEHPALCPATMQTSPLMNSIVVNRGNAEYYERSLQGDNESTHILEYRMRHHPRDFPEQLHPFAHGPYKTVCRQDPSGVQVTVGLAVSAVIGTKKVRFHWTLLQDLKPGPNPRTHGD